MGKWLSCCGSLADSLTVKRQHQRLLSISLLRTCLEEAKTGTQTDTRADLQSSISPISQTVGTAHVSPTDGGRTPSVVGYPVPGHCPDRTEGGSDTHLLPRRKELLLGARLELESVMLSERSWTLEDQHCVIHLHEIPRIVGFIDKAESTLPWVGGGAVGELLFSG